MGIPNGVNYPLHPIQICLPTKLSTVKMCGIYCRAHIPHTGSEMRIASQFYTSRYEKWDVSFVLFLLHFLPSTFHSSMIWTKLFLWFYISHCDPTENEEKAFFHNVVTQKQLYSWANGMASTLLLSHFIGHALSSFITLNFIHPSMPHTPLFLLHQLVILYPSHTYTLS